MIPFFRRNGRLMLAGIAVSLFCFALSALFTAQSAVPTGSWGLSFRTEGQPPIGNATAAALRNYDAVYVGDTEEKVIYLTFDAGYEAGYTEQILDVLKKHDVKAAFFVVGTYIENNPELVRRMIDEGHVVGNHSWKHPNYSGLSVEEAEQDLMKLHNYVKENFDYTMRYFRFPSGNFSERALAEAQQLGYKSIFWSFAYRDWLTDDQPNEAEALKKIVDSACPGMIYLLHAVSKTNADILADVIDGVTAKGFTWGDPAKI